VPFQVEHIRHFRTVWATTQRHTDDVPTNVDLSGLTEDLRVAARFTNSGKEVMWPRELVERVVNALADNEVVILGLDLRSDGDGYTPLSLATEVPWSAYRPDPSSRIGEIEEARRQALDALRNPRLAELDEYRWVLISW
jgi:hypothetical protein